MQEEFEKKVQERTHTFGIPPSPQVWDDIDAVLSKRKHRRVFVGWWILLGLVVIGGGVLLYKKDVIMRSDRNQHPDITNNDTTHNNLVNTTPATPQKQITPADESIVKKDNEGIDKKQNEVSTGKQDAGDIKKDNGAVAANTNKKYQAQATQNTSKAVINGGTVQVQKSNLPPAGEVTAANRQPAGNPTANTPPAGKEAPTALQAGVKPPAGSVDSALTAQQETAKEHTVTLPAEKKPGAVDSMVSLPGKLVSLVAPRRHQWFFTVSGGTTQTVSFGAFNETGNKALAAAITAQNVYALTSPAVLKYDIARPGTGFHISAGGEYHYNLSARWRLSAGLQVTYLSNTQKTGALYANLLDINTGSYGNLNTSSGPVQPTYYQSGPSSVNTAVNKAWWVQVPVDVSYVVNPHAKTKLLLNAGVSGAKMVSSEWLIPDARSGKLYYNKSVLNGTILNWQAGPMLQFSSRLKLGLSYQQSFTTMAKEIVSPKLYWQNVSVNVAIPIKPAIKKAKK